MSVLTLSAFQPGINWPYPGTTATLRYTYSADFVDSLGVPILRGLYKDVPCTVAGGVLSVAQHTLITTNDAMVNPLVTLSAQFLDERGAKRAWLFQQYQIPESLTPTTSIGALEVYNQGSSLVLPPDSYLNREQVIDLINLMAGSLNFAGLGVLGRISTSKAPLLSTMPIAIENSDARGIDISSYASWAAMIAAVGSTPTTFNIHTNIAVTSSSTAPSTLTLRFLQGGGVTVTTGQTLTINGPIIADPVKIFYNATASQGTVALLNQLVQEVYPEWWGAVAGGNATTNTTAIQAAIIGAYGSNRVNGAGLYGYNRILKFNGLFDIDDELRCYHMASFQWIGESQIGAGLRQNTVNKRIIDGQSVAYGTFTNLFFQGGAASNVALIDIDYDGSQGSDLRPQNITFYDCVIQGLTYSTPVLPTNFIGVHIAKSGAGAQGDNIRFYNCYVNGFSEAGVQLGTALAFAQNAIDVQFIGGDIQGCPKHALAAYGGNFIVAYTTLENGNVTSGNGVGQTDYELFASGSIITNRVSNVRSEGMKFAWGAWDISSCSVLGPQVTYTTQWPSQPGAASFINQLVTGTPFGGDGIMYLVSNVGVYGGLVDTTATGGSLTTVVKTAAGWTINAFVGQRVTIMSGTGKYQYGVITSNTADTLTCAAGFVSNYALRTDTGLPVVITAPDATSHFVIEPDWNAGAITSGTVNMTALSVNALDGDTGFQGVVENFNSGYGTRIRVVGPSGLSQSLSRIRTTRTDWLTANTNILDSTYAGVCLSQIIVRRPNAADNENCVWSVPRNGPTSFTDYSQNQVGSEWTIWSRGDVGGGASWLDLGIGRGDGINHADGNAVSRNVLGYLGMLGRRTPSGTNQAGANTDIQTGLPTGSGVPGNYNVWAPAAVGASGTTVRPGQIVAGVSGRNGISWSFKGADVASAVAIVPTGNLFHVTGTTNITSITATGVVAGSEITIIFDDVLTFTDGSNLVLAGNFVTTTGDTITLKFDGTNFYETCRSVN